jgi:hypothetical protein
MASANGSRAEQEQLRCFALLALAIGVLCPANDQFHAASKRTSRTLNADAGFRGMTWAPA